MTFNKSQFILNKEDLAKAYRKARLNLLNYRKIILINDDMFEVEPAPFHFEWSDDLLNSKDNYAIEGFRESGKGQYAVRSFCLYSLTFPDRTRDFIVIIKETSTLAEKKLKEIEDEYINNPAAQISCVEIKEKSGQVFSVDVRDDSGVVHNVRIEAYGKGSAIRGLDNKDRRPKIIIVDDPQSSEDSRSETTMANDWDWFTSDILFLGKHARVFLIGNNLGEKCIVERVIKEAPNLTQIRFKTKVIPQVIDGMPAWPARDTLDKIDHEKEDYRRLGKLDIWLREKMCQAVSEESRVFHSDDYRYYTAMKIDKLIVGSNMYATLDPATSKDKNSCYRAIVVNAVKEGNDWMLPDIRYGRWDPIKLIDEIFDVVVMWRIKNFGIEKGMLKDVLEAFIYKEMSARNIFFNIIPIEHAKFGSKLERIKMLAPRFKAHKIWFPDSNAPWVTELIAELAGVTNTDIKSLQIDLVDALAMQEQIAKVPFRQQAVHGLPREAEGE